MAGAGSIHDELSAERDLSGRRERLLAGENEVLKLIVERAPLRSILTQVARVAERQGSPGLLASILLMDDDGIHLRHGAAPSLPDSYNREIDGLEIGPAVGSCGTAAHRREAVIVSDIGSDPLWADFRELALAHGLQACWSTPIQSARGQVLGTFALYYRQPTTPSADERTVVQILTRTCALAIENKAAERTLHDSEERFRLLSRCSPIGVFTTDAPGAFTYVNPKFQEISGYGFEKTVEYWLENASDPSCRSQARREWQDAATKRIEVEAELALSEEAGGRRVRLRAAPMSASGGVHIGYVGTLEDITPYYRAATELRDESAFRVALEESLPCGIAAVDADGRQTYVNRAFCEMVGWSAEELTGAAPPFRYWPEEERERIGEALRQTVAGEVARPGFRMRFQRRCGETFDALVTIAPLTNVAPDRAGWVASVLDISAWKRAERSLGLTEARLAVALEAGRMGAWEWDIRTGRIEWSPQLEVIHGLPPGAFAGSFEAFQADMKPEDRPKVLAAIETALRTHEPYQVEYEIARPDGRAARVAARGKVVLDESGNASRMVGICMDVTDRM